MKQFYINIDNNTRLSVEVEWKLNTFSIAKENRALVNAGTEKKWYIHTSICNLPIDGLNSLRDALDKIEVMLLLK